MANEENDNQKTYVMSIENDDGTLSDDLEIKQLSSLQIEPPESKDNVSLLLGFRIEAFQPIVINASTMRLVLSREIVRKMAESLGLINS